MLKTVRLNFFAFDAYHGVISDELFTQIKVLARQLKGQRVLHISSTASRGGVAQILASSVPMLRALGIQASWQIFPTPPKEFYKITKLVHNALQGAPEGLKPAQWRDYEKFNKSILSNFRAADWDYVFIHDHQPAAAPYFLKDRGAIKWLWRSHTDSSIPNIDSLRKLINYLSPYQAALYTMKDYQLAGFKPERIVISPPAIDPFSYRNRPISLKRARQVLRSYGVDPNLPIAVQISRIDPWKDFPGVIKAWQLARQQIPQLQLVLVGKYSLDDDQARSILSQMTKATKNEPRAHLIINQSGPRADKAFQVANSVVLQKSVREGFGLTVSEALWSNRPVIGGNVGGIKLQIQPGKNGYLVDTIEDCADRMIEIVNDPMLAAKMGTAGHEHVRQHFLLPRLVRDELKLMIDIA